MKMCVSNIHNVEKNDKIDVVDMTVVDLLITLQYA